MRVVVQLSRGWSWYQICSLVSHSYTTVARLKLLKDASLALQRNQLFKIKLESQIEWCCCDLNALAIANHNARLTSNCFFDYHRCDYFCQEYFYGRKDEKRGREREIKGWNTESEKCFGGSCSEKRVQWRYFQNLFVTEFYCFLTTPH